MNYYEHHIGDFLKKTIHLSAVEEGIYRRLLDRCYTVEGPLPADVRECCRLARALTAAERTAVKAMLAEFFTLTARGHEQKRASEEIARFQAKSAKAKEAAATRWKGRAGDANGDADADASGMPRAPVPSLQSPDTSPQLEIPSNLAVAPALPPEDRPPLDLLGDPEPQPGPKPYVAPDCPHQQVLALWAEVLPAMPQHLPSQWGGTRGDHLRTRWKETADEKRWASAKDGLTYLRKLFTYVGESDFLTGRAPHPRDKRPFLIELEWLVMPRNWAKVHEGKYHGGAA